MIIPQVMLLTLLCLALLGMHTALRTPLKPRGGVVRASSSHPPLLKPTGRSVRLGLAEETPTPSQFDSNTFAALGATGVLSNAVCDYSLYVLKTTSCGLPPGPFGLLGLAEGISYLVVVGIAGWSAYSKVKTY
jgi:hypothetical protein